MRLIRTSPGSPAPAGVMVIVVDLQHDVPVDLAQWQHLAEKVLADEGITGPAELSMRFVDEPEIAELNDEYLGQPGSTDVLSFPLDDGPAESATSLRLLGDIVICPAVAARNAPEHAGTLEDELALLVVHGVLHILGHDHAELDEAKVMRAREADLLARHHRAVLVGTELPPTGPDHR